MKFYYIKDDYIAYLKKYDSKVSDNKHSQRPYVGIVLQINGINYYTPFSSPKSKHKHMKNSKDFRKINLHIKQRCCNLPLLESIFSLYSPIHL